MLLHLINQLSENHAFTVVSRRRWRRRHLVILTCSF